MEMNDSQKEDEAQNPVRILQLEGGGDLEFLSSGIRLSSLLVYSFSNHPVF